MASESPESLASYLSPAIASALSRDPGSPLQHWLKGENHDAIALLTYASTLPEDDGYAVGLAAASACLLDSAFQHKPIRLDYAMPLWRTVTQGEIPSAILVPSDGRGPNEIPSPSKTISPFDDYAAVGIARIRALDAPARRILIDRASTSNHPVTAALGWFAYDLCCADKTGIDEAVLRFPSRWACAFPHDEDAAILSFRAYLSAARRVGVIGALDPVIEETRDARPLMSVAEAAGVVAWDEAARAGAHGVCADLALRRARQRPLHSSAQHRWLLLYGFHAEHLPERSVDGPPVARELLDMMYHSETNYVAASLAVSIAARTNRLEAVLRETLPYLRGPTVPMLRAAFGIGDQPRSLKRLATLNAGGALLALRFAYLRQSNSPLQLDVPIAPRRTPPPAPILDDFENNEDFLESTFGFEDEKTLPRADVTPRHPISDTGNEITSTTPTESRPMRARVARSQSTDVRSQHWHDDWHANEKTDLIGNLAAETTDHHVRRPPSSTPDATDAAYASPQPANASPTDIDVELAAALPDDRRRQADALLGARILVDTPLDDAFYEAIEHLAKALPITALAAARALHHSHSYRRAAVLYEQVARSTHDRRLRAERYRDLGNLWKLELARPDRAIEYYIVSFTCDPCEETTLLQLGDVYKNLGRYDELHAIYEAAALAAEHAGDMASAAKWRSAYPADAPPQTPPTDETT